MTVSAHGVNKLTGDAKANRKIFKFAKTLGVQAITADPDPDSFDNLDELVKEFDIRVAIHNHGPSHRYNKVVDVLNAIEGHDERIGACADLGHYIRSGETPTEVIRLLKGRLYGIHLKDFAEMKEKTEGVILGKGPSRRRRRFLCVEIGRLPQQRSDLAGVRRKPRGPHRRHSPVCRGSKGRDEQSRGELKIERESGIGFQPVKSESQAGSLCHFLEERRFCLSQDLQNC